MRESGLGPVWATVAFIVTVAVVMTALAAGMGLLDEWQERWERRRRVGRHRWRSARHRPVRVVAAGRP